MPRYTRQKRLAVTPSRLIPWRLAAQLEIDAHRSRSRRGPGMRQPPSAMHRWLAFRLNHCGPLASNRLAERVETATARSMYE
jgi:hypothetical protein